MNTINVNTINDSTITASTQISVFGRNWSGDERRSRVAVALTEDQRIHVSVIGGVNLSLEGLFAIVMQWEPLAKALDAINVDTRKYPCATKIDRTCEGDFNAYVMVNEEAANTPWLLNVDVAWRKVAVMHITTNGKLSDSVDMWLGDFKVLMGALVKEANPKEFQRCMDSYKERKLRMAEDITMVTQGWALTEKLSR